MFPMSINTDEFVAEMLDMNHRAIESAKVLSGLSEEDLDIGTAPKHEVYSDSLITLYRYEPVVPEDEIHPVPLLISYALVNRPYMVDLQENRSLVRNLLNLGLDVYLIDWGYPQRNDRFLTLDDYVNRFIDGCVDHIREAHDLDQINLLGICQGGVMSMCYTALHQEKIQNLITMVAPVDFHTDEGMLNRWMGCGTEITTIEPERMVEAMGNIPGDFMNFGFLMLKPFELGFQKYFGLLDSFDNVDRVVNFMRMEKWIFDSPDQAGAAWLEFLNTFYLENKLIKGEAEIGGHRVDLSEITVPVLNLYAEKDHLVPPASSVALGEYIGTDDYTVESFPVGHIGMYVSGRVQGTLPPTIADWLKERS